MNKFAANTAKASQASARSLQSINGSIDGIGPALTRMGGTFAAAFSVREVISMADTFTQFRAKLINAKVASEDMARVQQGLFAAARANGQEVTSLADLYGNMSMSAKSLGLNQKQMMAATEGVAAAMRLSGSSTAQASATILQLGQALAGGTVRAEEYNSMLENAPALVRAIAESSSQWQGDLGKLRQEINAGTVSSKEWADAIVAASAKLKADAANAPLTVAAGIQNLRTSLIEYIGEADQSLGASEKLGYALTKLGENVDLVVDSLMVVSTFIAGRYIASMVMAGVTTATTTYNTIKMSTAMVGASRSTLLASTAMTGFAAAAKGALALVGGPLGLAITAVALAVGGLSGQMMDASSRTAALSSVLETAGHTLDNVRSQAGYAATASATMGASANAAGGQVTALGNRAQTAAAQLREYAAAQRDAAIADINRQRTEITKNRDRDYLQSRDRRRARETTLVRSPQEFFGRIGNFVSGEASDLWTNGQAERERQARIGGYNLALGRLAEAERVVRSTPDSAYRQTTTTPAADTPRTTRTGGGGGPVNGGRDSATDREREQDRIDDASERARIEAQRREVAARQALAKTSEDRLSNAIELITLEHQDLNRQLDQQLADKEITQAAYDTAKLSNEAAMEAQLELAAREDYRQVLEEQADMQRTLLDLQQSASRIEEEVLRNRASLAKTVEERARLETEAFDLRQRSEKEAFDASQEETRARLRLANQLTAEVEARLQREAAAFTERQQTEQAGHAEDVRQMNPFAKFVDSAKDMKFALQDIAANGLKTLEDGLVDVIMRTGSLGDAFKSMSKQVIADLARIAIQKAIVGPLANFLGFGDGAGMFNFFSPNRNAIGTRHSPGGLTMVGEAGPELVNMPRGSQVLPNGDVRKLAVKQGSAGPRQNIYNFSTTVNADGAVMRDDIRNEIYQAHLLAVQEAKSQTMTDIGNSQRRRLR